MSDPIAAPNLDEVLRRMAAERLAQQLAVGLELVAQCREEAQTGGGDHIAPLSVAARLINSNARMAHALGHIALVERRSRTIVEHIQPAKPVVELNSINQQSEDRAVFKDLERRILGQLADQRREARLHPKDPCEDARYRLEDEEGIDAWDG